MVNIATFVALMFCISLSVAGGICIYHIIENLTDSLRKDKK